MKKCNQNENPTYRLEDRLGGLLGRQSKRTKRWKIRQEKKKPGNMIHLRDSTSE